LHIFGQRLDGVTDDARQATFRQFGVQGVDVLEILAKYHAGLGHREISVV